MGKTFRDISKIKGLSPKMIQGRAAPRPAGHKETFDGTSRMTREGRLKTFINSSPAPRPSTVKSAIKYGK